MHRSVFDRDVFLKMEEADNPFVAARALALRARQLNTRSSEEGEVSLPAAPAAALSDYVEGRIVFSRGEEDP